MSQPEEESFITADEAIFELDLAVNGMGQTGQLGRMEGDEARKLAEYLFADDDDPMPEEMRKFFNFPEGE